MTSINPLIGRERERGALEAQAGRAIGGDGAIVLLGGEAGIGKTTLARAVLTDVGLERLDGFGVQEGATPYGPIVDVLRRLAHARSGSALNDRDRRSTMAVLLPELGRPAQPVDMPSLFDGICSVLAAAAAERPLAILLDDMHWADEATASLLPALARALETEPVLVVVAYRNDEISREHPIRRLRNDLRRDHRLHELILEPLDAAETAELLGQALGGSPAASLCDAIIARSGGVPFFVAELGSALAHSGRLRESADGLQLLEDEPLPLPENIRDAVLLRASGLDSDARELVAVAAVMGQTFDVEPVMAIAGVDAWPDELLRHGAVTEESPGRMAFAHGLVRETFYREVPSVRRTALHGQIAHRLEADGAAPPVVAEHWVLAREPARARRSFMAVVDSCCSVHAYRDGLRAARRALELSVDGGEASRLEVLERLAACAELAGEPGEAARAWREIAESGRDGEPLYEAEAWHRHAGALEIQGRWEEALSAREAAADAFTRAEAAAEATAERLAAAAHLRSAASFARHCGSWNRPRATLTRRGGPTSS